MKPYYEDDMVKLYNEDMRHLVPNLGVWADAVITDPPYGETSLTWDQWPYRWPDTVAMVAQSMWCFGSFRMFTDRWPDFEDAGWKLSQEIVWEKHNGSGFAADRFKRVHELAAHFYRGRWEEIYRQAVRVPHSGPENKGGKRMAESRDKPAHTGHIGKQNWVDDGTRLMRSVIQARSMHGRAIHPTEKPAAILAPLIEYAVPEFGLVLDPFAGSGSTLLTARQLNRRAIGIEASEEYCEKAAKRLSEPDLFSGGVA